MWLFFGAEVSRYDSFPDHKLEPGDIIMTIAYSKKLHLVLILSKDGITSMFFIRYDLI